MSNPTCQLQPIDVAQWELDAEFAVYPEGSRPKSAVFAPAVPPDPCLIPGRRYLFKWPKRAYPPDHYWAEVVAYRIGSILGLDVPPAFAALDSATGRCGVLIQWFYEDGEARLVAAGELLQHINPAFDRQEGEHHNLADIRRLFFAMRFGAVLDPDIKWREWWTSVLLFDTLIGNTDRHQENWGFLYRRVGTRDIATLAPCFDNGSSFGAELPMSRVRAWSPAQTERYIDRGCHHVRWNQASEREPHLQLTKRLLSDWPNAAATARELLERVDLAAIESTVHDLQRLDLPAPLTPERSEFMLTLIEMRLERLKAAL